MSSAPADVVEALDFTLDRAAEVPIGVQLAWAIRTRIEDGRLAPGRRLPGLREVAEALGVNSNTARAVYSRLELEGVVESRQGSGTFVAAGTPRSVSASAIATNAAQEALEVGVDPREVAAALYVSATQAGGSGGIGASVGGIEAARKRLLRSQIAALEQAIGELETEHPRLVRPVATPAAQARQPRPKLPSADELETVRLDLLRRLATLQAQIDELAGARIDELAERQAPARPVKTRAKAASKAGKRPARRSGTRPAAAGA